MIGLLTQDGGRRRRDYMDFRRGGVDRESPGSGQAPREDIRRVVLHVHGVSAVGERDGGLDAISMESNGRRVDRLAVDGHGNRAPPRGKPREGARDLDRRRREAGSLDGRHGGHLNGERVLRPDESARRHHHDDQRKDRPTPPTDSSHQASHRLAPILRVSAIRAEVDGTNADIK